MRLGHRQKDILIKMATGWELGGDLTMHGGHWIQKGGLGYGGETIHNLSSDSVRSLSDKGLIKIAYRQFPTQGYILTEKGKELANSLIAKAEGGNHGI